MKLAENKVKLIQQLSKENVRMADITSITKTSASSVKKYKPPAYSYLITNHLKLIDADRKHSVKIASEFLGISKHTFWKFRKIGKPTFLRVRNNTPIPECALFESVKHNTDFAHN